MNREELRAIIKGIVMDMLGSSIPVGVSNRHLHLCKEDFDILFPHMELTKKKDLKQIGEFASDQTVSLIGPKGRIDKVRILGPLRSQSQVEVSLTDARQLGVNPPIVQSGQLDRAVPITIQTEFGTIEKPICIVAKRHIHMSLDDAKRLHVSDGQSVQVQIESNERTTIFDDVIVRAKPNFVLEIHIDTDEANACGATNESIAHIIQSKQ